MNQELDTVIVVLGSPNDEDGNLSDIAKSRCTKAFESYQTLKTEGSCAVLTTGGFGEHFNRTNKPHAEYTKQYMIELGVPKSVFLESALSRHSVEDAVFSWAILKHYTVDTYYIITSSYHVPRAEYIFRYVYDEAQKITMVPATVMLAQEEQDKLIAHEKQALAGLKKNGIIYEGL